MVKLIALMRRVSDTTLIALTLSIFGTLILIWYLWWYTPLIHEITVLEQQVVRLRKRTTTVAKRLESSSWVLQELAAYQAGLQIRAATLLTESQIVTQVLTHAAESGVYIRSWKPGKQQVHDCIILRDVAVEFEGTFEQVLAFLAGVNCSELLLTKLPHAIGSSCILQVLSRRVP